MDSKKGEALYWKECNEYWRQQNPVIVTKLITFAPYPGRFKWRKWWIIKKIKTFLWKLKHKPIKIDLVCHQVKPTSVLLNQLYELKPMEAPDNAIFYLTWDKEKNGWKENET